MLVHADTDDGGGVTDRQSHTGLEVPDGPWRNHQKQGGGSSGWSRTPSVISVVVCELMENRDSGLTSAQLRSMSAPPPSA